MECKGCQSGIAMCHHRPCLGTPEEFEKIILAGHTEKLRIDWWHGHHGYEKPDISDEAIAKADPLSRKLMELLKAITPTEEVPDNPHKDNVEFLTGGTATDVDYKSAFMPTGSCKFLTKDNLCELHDLGLKPQQGRESCCKSTDQQTNLPYVDLWATDKGREVVQLFRDTVGI